MVPAAVVLCLILLGGLLTGARIHGFSFSAWHTAIDGSPPDEVFLNQAQGYRSDDWLVALPHALAQRADTPAFPIENRLIGDGHYNMRITGAAPVRDPMVLFRPQVWGYFISGDIGMAWQWWFNALGLWMVMWLVLRRLTGNDNLTSVCGATALLFAPFFQAWSLNCAPTVIFAGGTLLALTRLRSAASTMPLLLSAALLAWCGTAFLLTFNYLPYLVALLYFIIFVFGGIAFTKRDVRTGQKNYSSAERPRQSVALHNDQNESRRNASRPTRDKLRLPHVSRGRVRWGCAAMAVLVILGMGAYIMGSNWETIQVIQHSDYPGQRVSTGGDQTIWHLFRGNILSVKPPLAWRDFNPCEGAAFFLLFPVVVAALLRDWWRTRQPPAPLILGITGYIIFLLIWNLAGFTESWSRWTLMSRAPPFRTLIGLGLADLCLLAVYVAGKRHSTAPRRPERITPWIVCALWIVFQVALALKLSRYFPDYSLAMALIAGLFSMALAPLLYLAPRLVIPAIMIASILTTYDINPLARGGTTFVRENPLSRKIQDLDQTASALDRQPIWIAYGDLALPNLLRMIGARALNGVHAYPQFELWQTLDPAGQYRTAYNRYAHVIFDLPATPDEFNIHLVQTDIVTVFLHPDDPRFDALNVDYLLCLDDQVATLDRIRKLKRVYSYAGKHVYGAERAINRISQTGHNEPARH